MAGYISPHTPVPPLEDIPIPSADYFPGQNRTDYIYGFTIPYCLLAIFLAGCRIYVRRVLLNAVGLDDWLLLGSLTFTLANGSMGLWELRYGFGRHVIDIVRDGGNPHRLSIVSRFFMCCVPVYSVHSNGESADESYRTYFLQHSPTSNSAVYPDFLSSPQGLLQQKINVYDIWSYGSIDAQYNGFTDCHSDIELCTKREIEQPQELPIVMAHE